MKEHLDTAIDQSHGSHLALPKYQRRRLFISRDFKVTACLQLPLSSQWYLNRQEVES